MTQQERINGSGLFFFNSTLEEKKKVEILDWYESLPKEQKEYVSILMKE